MNWLRGLTEVFEIGCFFHVAVRPTLRVDGGQACDSLQPSATEVAEFKSLSTPLRRIP